ncbi:symmetrical bis(5'-nucleosyl)-tetraphosphatase [Aliikangiella sp. G2MR2-5]|uniref:symmetrical bis(5'-nucleosyl)-tetraphosphatase n=1 Tax=Aliikangiella sp. G2MR2-5 TaxID=2788943 RepID=UPI0018AC878D|nr:symmetrical bis(5'-nucleosyl)-tetraphosphatase [Aliikangiella sp. G2MR2-5]
MATYAIGDIQGCYQTLLELLNKIHFDPKEDNLWIAGDLINRGPQSLQTLKFLYQHKESVRCVLGNHDLHFLAVESGEHLPRPKDTFESILNSPDRKCLTHWLRQQPLIYHDYRLGFTMVHAGIPFYWNLDLALALAKEVSDCLLSPNANIFFKAMYGNEPVYWSPKLNGMDRLRFITNALTRMRFCDKKGGLDLENKLSPGTQPKHLLPWFDLGIPSDTQLLFGHWASLQGKVSKPGLFALDTGCVWRGQLSALRLEDKQWFRVDSKED